MVDQRRPTQAKSVVTERAAPLVFDAHLILWPLIARLKSLKILHTDKCPHETPWLVVSWPRPDNSVMRGAIQATLRGRDGVIRVRFMSHDDAPRECEQVVRLITDRGVTGGRVWWFVCPHTGARCMTLYLPLGCAEFRSAVGHKLASTAYRGLETKAHLARCYAKLGVHYVEGEAHIPARPAGMGIAQYKGLVAKITRLTGEISGPPGFMNLRPGRGRPRKSAAL